MWSQELSRTWDVAQSYKKVSNPEEQERQKVIGGDQREGMGQLEYQAMPSFREVAHDGWLCTFTI